MCNPTITYMLTICVSALTTPVSGLSTELNRCEKNNVYTELDAARFYTLITVCMVAFDVK